MGKDKEDENLFAFFVRLEEQFEFWIIDITSFPFWDLKKKKKERKRKKKKERKRKKKKKRVRNMNEE